MEDDEPMECESEVHPCPERIDSLSLIISAEEEETQRHSDSGLLSAGEDGPINGHGTDEGEDPATPLCSPGTSYWSVSEGPDFPFLLSPEPKPAGPQRRLSKPRAERASRPGLSRIPGRDHRRYYHEYWRSEYLMDFDPRRHGMICMVCGSSLATLKLSTIKRHIQQKHPDSLLWSAADKEVIRSGWESHLSLEGGQRPYCTEAKAGAVQEGALSCARRSTGKPSPGTPKRQSSLVSDTEEAARAGSPDASAHTLERYLNDSLHAWFRQEFLMEYEAGRSRLLCMVCGSQLPSLHLDHIKRHVLDVHPNSLVYSAEEKHCILQTWAKRQEYDPLRGSIPVKSEPCSEDGGPQGGGFLSAESERVEPRRSAEPGQGTGWPRRGHLLRSPPPSRGRTPRAPLPQRWRLDHLVGRGPGGRGLCCMVCSEALPAARVSCFRQHTQERHPETVSLDRSERQALADAWDREFALLPPTLPLLSPGGQALQTQEEAAPDAPATLALAAERGKMVGRSGGRAEDGGGGRGRVPRERPTSTPTGRHSHYPGKDQRRNYQVRWRLEYLMDYDCRRHGLICMVCGAALATLKVSTIKRHILQVHPDSLGYGPAERQEAMLSYNQTALRFVHSDGCFSSLNHGNAAGNAVGNAGHLGLAAGFCLSPQHPLPSGSKNTPWEGEGLDVP